MILKNVKHRLKLALTNLRVVARHDVLIEKDVTIKYAESLRFGAHCTLQSGVYVYGSRSGKLVSFGSHVVIGAGGMVLGEGGVEIGDFTHFGPHVVLTTQFGDNQQAMSSVDMVLKTIPVTLGAGCWIGSGSVIMPGTTLGDNCVVAPNSVVYGAWPARTRLLGNPARRIASAHVIQPDG